MCTWVYTTHKYTLFYRPYYVHTRYTWNRIWKLSLTEVYYVFMCVYNMLCMLNEFKMLLLFSFSNQCFHRNYLAQIHVHLNAFICVRCFLSFSFSFPIFFGRCLKDKNFEIYRWYRNGKSLMIVVTLSCVFFSTVIFFLSMCLSLLFSLPLSCYHSSFHPKNSRNS